MKRLLQRLVARPQRSAGRRISTPDRRRGQRAALSVEALESRRVLAAYVVDTLVDNPADDATATDGVVSLREAIAAANSNAAFGDAVAGSADPVAPDTITFAPGLGGTITLGGTELAITDAVAISMGDTAVTISGDQLSRIFNVNAAGVSITGLGLEAGSAESGGAILAGPTAQLSLTGVTIANSVATGAASSQGGGAIFIDASTVTIADSTFTANGASGSAGSGGAIFNDAGTLAITGGVISGNFAIRAGGGIEATAGSTTSLTNVQLGGDGDGVNDSSEGNEVFNGPGNGGGLHITGNGNATISGGTVVGNLAGSEGGGLWNGTGSMTIDGTLIAGNVANGSAADNGGGGVFNAGGNLTITGAAIRGNAAGTRETTLGGFFSLSAVNSDPTVNGLGTFELDALTGLFGLNVGISGLDLNDDESDGESQLTAMELRVGERDEFGDPVGASELILDLLADGTGAISVSDDSLDFSVGDQNFPEAFLADLLSGRVFVNVASAANPSGEIRGFLPVSIGSASGGGVFNEAGTATISNTIIAGNSAIRAGGGIEVTGGSTTTLTDVQLGTDDDLAPTDLGNFIIAAANPGNGGGLHVSGDGAVTITRGRVSGNTAVEGGGLWNSATGSMTVTGTTISGNTATRGGGVYQDNTEGIELFTAPLSTLNAAFGSTASGTARLTLDTSGIVSPTEGIATIRVQISATGLQDLSGVPGGVHVAHIHGQFEGNAARPLAEQGDGPFFDGAGGTPVDSLLPTTEADGALNIDESVDFGTPQDYLDFFEGRPQYGPVVLNLTANQLDSAPAGTPPLTFFFEQVAAGNIDPAAEFPSGTTFDRDTTYTFDLSDPDAARQYNNLIPLSAREIVLHGLTIPTNISDAIDAATGAAPGSPTSGTPLGEGTSFRRTAPVAAGEIVVADAVVHLTLTDVTIIDNAATGDEATDGGGGLHNAGGSVTITDGQISGNDAPGAAGSGGGVFNAGQLTATGTVIAGNTAVRAGGGIEAVGGSTTTLTGVTLGSDGDGTDDDTEGNVATGVGAPGNGGGIHLGGDAVARFNAGTVRGNTAVEGGGIWLSGSATVTTGFIGFTPVGTMIIGNEATGAESDQGGGGIYNVGGTLTVNGGSISGNVASGAAGSGGGVFVGGGMTRIAGATIDGNTANRAGGGVETREGSDVNLSAVTLTNNVAGPEGSASPGNGGGLHVTGDGDVGIAGGLIAGNFAAAEGGGLWNGAGTMTIGGTTIRDNTASGDDADQGGGGIYNLSGTVNLSTVVLSGNVADGAAGSGGGILNEGILTATDTRFFGNSAVRAGGGIETTGGTDVTLTRVTIGTDGNGTDDDIEGNVATGEGAPGNGGGLHIGGDGMVTIADSSIRGNNAVEGGGLWNSPAGTLTVTRSLVADNAAGAGGGVYNEADQTGGGGTVSLVNTTISGNTATGNGGGVFTAGGDVSHVSVTIAMNTAADGGGVFAGAGTVTANNTVVSLNTGGEITGTVDGVGNFVGGDPQLGALAFNGGPTQTHLPAADSPLVDAGVNSASAGLDTDQRGGNFFESFDRIVDAVIDIGAVEVQDVTAGGGLVVNSFGDTADLTDDLRTLREAIIAANANPGADTITLPAGTFVLGNAGGGEDAAATGDLDITDALTIIGAGMEDTIIDASALDDRAFEVFATTLSLSGLTITGGRVLGDGGGIANRGGTVTGTDIAVLGNAAVANGLTAQDAIPGSGGGLFNEAGTVTLTDSLIAGNTARRAGGGIEVTGGSVTTLTNVILGQIGNGNSVAGDPAPGNGGGLHISGDGVVTITAGSVVGNAAVEGGGLWNSATGTLTVDGTSITGNTAVRGGGVYQDDASDIQTFTADLSTLNAAFGSNAAGTATITVDTSGIVAGNTDDDDDTNDADSGTATVRVRINATGLQDLTGVMGGVHVAHIHGQFEGNAARPLAEQGDGPFFDGAGGVAVDSVLPTTEADGALNIDETDQFGTAADYLDFFEGRPSYGPVVLNLTANQLASAPEGTAPLNFFFAEVAAGRIDPAAEFPAGTEFVRDTTYTFDLSDADAARQYANLLPLEFREIVLHGLTIPTAISDAIDAATGAAPGTPTAGVPVDDGDGEDDNNVSFRRTAPVAAGEIVAAASTQLTLTGVTISGNTATGEELSDGGGGLHNAGGSVSITGSTISDNVAGSRDRVITDAVTLSGDQENPPVATEATGTANFTYDADAGTYDLTLTVTGVDLNEDESDGTSRLTRAHFHVGDVGVNGPVFVNLLDDDSQFVDNGDGTLTLTITDEAFPSAFVDELLAGNVYINVHSTANPSGEIRGQIEPTFAGGDSAASGGGILNAGVLTVSDSMIQANEAPRAGGGIEATAGSTTTLTDTDLIGNSVGSSPGNGGGLHITGDGDASIIGGTVSGNSAGAEGGGLWNGAGRMTITNVAIAGNFASGTDAGQGGGGLYNNGGVVTIAGGSITGNVADGTGNGNDDDDTNDVSGSGGGILNSGTLTVTGTVIAGNSANRAGGGIEATAGSTTDLIDVTLGSDGDGTDDDTEGNTAGTAPGNGGGLHITGDGVVTISGGSVVGNSAVEGGGLWNSGSGSLSIDGTTISGNTALRGGGVYQDQSAGVQTFTVNLQTLNAAFGSTATGTATITLDTSAVVAGDPDDDDDSNDDDSGTATIRVQINATGLQDLTEAQGGIHVAHIHGQFAGNASRPLAEQGSGPFFSGSGGVPVNSALPTTQRDGARNIDESVRFGTADDYLDFFEGRPQYGPVVLNLTANQLDSAPEGIAPLTFFFQQLAAGNIDAAAEFPAGETFTLDTTYRFDLSDADARRQFNNLTPLSAREIVLHGLLIPTEISDAIDVATGAVPGDPTAGVDQGDGTTFRRTAPVAAGEIVAASGSVTITRATITNNTATGDQSTDGGGGIYNAGTLSVTNSSITGNAAAGDAGSGGGLFNASAATVSDSEISGNSANRAGGGIEAVGGSGTQLIGVTLDGNDVGSAPGNGGGLHAGGDAAVTITDSSITGNSATSEGGGLWNSSAGTLTVTRSLVAGNTAGAGGGIYNDGDGGTVTLVNSTISGNTATTAGGGIVSQGGTLTHTSVTIAMNTAATGGGVLISGGAASAINTIVAMNTATTGPDISGTITSGGNNLVGSTMGATIGSAMASDVTGVSPGLAVLADNGGPTLTHALVAGSPALSVGTLAGLTIDQRGVARPQGNGVDIGAFESELNRVIAGTTTLAISAVNSVQPEGDAGTRNFTFTVTRNGNRAGTTTVDFAVTGTGGLNAADFGGTLPSGTVTFQPSQSTATVTIPVSGDTEIESDEPFTVTLTNPTDGATISIPSAGGTIQDDDSIATNGTRLLAPQSVVRLHVIPGDNIPTAILFAAVRSTIVTVEGVSVGPGNSGTVRFLADPQNDGSVQPAGGDVNGVATLAVRAGDLYAIVFEPQSTDAVFSIRAEGGFDSLSTGVFTNILQPTDVNGNGQTSPLDALLIINQLNAMDAAGQSERSAQGEGAFMTPGGTRLYPDVTRDGRVTALDALRVINHLNRISAPQSEPIDVASFTPVGESISGVAIAPQGTTAAENDEVAEVVIESFDSIDKLVATADGFTAGGASTAMPPEAVDSVFSESIEQDDALLTLLAQ